MSFAPNGTFVCAECAQDVHPAQDWWGEENGLWFDVPCGHARQLLEETAKNLIAAGFPTENFHHALYDANNTAYDLSSGLTPEEFHKGSYTERYRRLSEWATLTK